MKLTIIALVLILQGCTAFKEINCSLSGYEKSEMEECDVELVKIEE
jgi:hypothetical protein